MKSIRLITATCLAIVVAGPLASLAAGQGVSETTDALKQRYQIKVMEGALVGAVRHGADVLGAQLKPVNPNLILLTGTAQAKGFFLDGYGVFFDVQIPALRESVAGLIQTLAAEPDPRLMQLVERLRDQISQLRDPVARASMEQNVVALERAAGITPQAAAAPARAGQAVAAASVDTTSAPAPPPKIPDPNVMYTEAVKTALVDAMLEYGGAMSIAPDQWLTIAARDAEGPLAPGEPYDAVTIVLRVKGVDLTGFRAGRLTQDEARKRVEVREF